VVPTPRRFEACARFPNSRKTQRHTKSKFNTEMAPAESNSGKACTYAALLLKDSQKEVTADNINALLKAAGVKVDASYARAFAKVLTPSTLDSLLEKLSKVGGAAPASATAASAAPAATTAASAAAAGKKEPEKEKSESEEEEDEDAFGGLF